MSEAYGEPVVRPLRADDAAAVRALFTAAFGNTLYAEAPRAALARALESVGTGTEDEQARGVVVETDGQTVGVAIYGMIVNAERAAKMHGMAVAADSRRHGVARKLIDAFVTQLAARGVRFILVEFPDASELAGGRSLLLHSKFVEESRVPDHFRDGIALAFLRRDLT